MAVIDALRDLLWSRDRGLCGICGEAVSRAEMQIDHIQPRSLNGPDSFDNLRPAHRLCNMRRGNRDHAIAESAAPYALRLSGRLHQELKQRAAESGQSMNRLINATLAAAVAEAKLRGELDGFR